MILSSQLRLRLFLFLRTHSRSGSCEMNSVTYFRVAGITPAAPFVLVLYQPLPASASTPRCIVMMGHTGQ